MTEPIDFYQPYWLSVETSVEGQFAGGISITQPGAMGGGTDLSARETEKLAAWLAAWKEYRNRPDPGF